LRVDWTHFITHGGAGLLLLGVICISSSAYVLLRSSGDDAWHETEGAITLARLERTQPGGQQRQRALFAYEYEVDGKTYRSDRYSFATLGGERTVGIAHYSRGDTVTVYYDPDHPSTAVLIKRRPGVFVYVVPVFGFLFLMASTGSLLA
jgi:hypothetical protein